MRRLIPSDFPDVWALAAPQIDRRLKPDMDQARKSYMLLISDATNYAVGEWSGESLAGLGMVTSEKNAYAGKGFGSVQLWLGSFSVLDAMIDWWEGRPALRFLSLQFPNDVRWGMRRALESRGFARSGDMNVLWR